MAKEPYAFSTHVGSLCVKRDTNVQKLGAALGINPMELLAMINGRQVPTTRAIAGLAKALDSAESYLTKLAAEIPRDRGAGE
jgi:plasmid maintenance system antidote protein VapI